MNRRGLYITIYRFVTLHIPLILLLGIPIVAIVSWVWSMYSDGTVNNLLDPDGIRWCVRSSVRNISRAPLAQTLVLFMCVSVLFESGLMGVLLTLARERKWSTGSLSLKQRRALMCTIGVFELIVVLLIVLIVFPGAILFTAFGTYESSSLQQGMWGIAAFITIASCNAFGYVSGKIITQLDFLRAHTFFISKCANYFITLGLAAEFVSCLEYTSLVSADTIAVLSECLYYIPIVFYFISAIYSRNDNFIEDISKKMNN